MTESEQLRAHAVLSPLLGKSASKPKALRNFPVAAQPELLDLFGFLEKLPADKRVGLGNTLLERTWTEREPRFWETLGKIGARVPVYASAHYVLAPGHAENWLEHLLREKWEQVPSAATAAARLARLTGDRARDISDHMRTEVVGRLTKVGASATLIQTVTEVVEVSTKETLQQFGEELPVGLVWHNEVD
jgi:hypothetical protein